MLYLLVGCYADGCARRLLCGCMLLQGGVCFPVGGSDSSAALIFMVGVAAGWGAAVRAIT